MRDPSRPLVTKVPAVGTVTRESTFSSVLFPAPFLPISPRLSPRFSEKVTSRSAQNSSRGGTARPRRREVRRPTSSLIEVTYQPPPRSLYRLETPESSMAVSDISRWFLSHHVGKAAFGALDHRERDEGQGNGNGRAEG